MPTRAQYFFARPWLFNAWLIAGSLAGSVFAVGAAKPSGTVSFLWLIGIVPIAAFLGFFLAFLVGGFVLGPIYYARNLTNAAPFHEGDMVHVLVGPHQDRVLRVYEVWDSRNQVRVELGEQEQKDVTDVLSYYQICRDA
jgi:hypothetical protein